MTLFLSHFKHFHGYLPAGPDQWLPRARTGKVSCDDNAHSWVLSHFQAGPCQDKGPSLLSHPNLLVFHSYCSYF